MLSDAASLALIPEMTGVSGAVLDALIRAADAAVKKYCKRDFEQADYTEFYDGNGLVELPLRQRPVDPTDMEVYVDPIGAYGYGTNAFPAATKLVLGTDYVPKMVGPSGLSESGLLIRLGGYPGSIDPWLPWISTADPRGTLTARPAPYWPHGNGNIKVLYTAGYADIPADLTQAVNQLACWMYFRQGKGGVPIQSESLGAYSYSLGLAGLNQAPELGSTRELLSLYVEWVV